MDFDTLIQQAQRVNALNAQLREIFPPQLQGVVLVRIDKGVAWLLADNSAVLQLAKNSDIKQYLAKLSLSIDEVVLELRR